MGSIFLYRFALTMLPKFKSQKANRNITPAAVRLAKLKAALKEKEDQLETAKVVAKITRLQVRQATSAANTATKRVTIAKAAVSKQLQSIRKMEKASGKATTKGAAR